MITTILWVSGILAAIAIFVPGAVVMGMYMLILPGLALALAPTVFVYTASFAVIRALLPLPEGIIANGASMVLTAALGFALALPANLAGKSAFAAAIRPDVPGSAVKLAGHVRLERNGGYHSRTSVPECDALCAALLDTPGVTSVTIAGSDREGAARPAYTYRLVPKAEAPESKLAPTGPETILDHLPKDQPTSGRRDFDVEIASRESARNAIKAKWALRLSTDQSLVSGPLQKRFDRTIAITELRAAGPHRISTFEIEVRGAREDVLLRRQIVTAEPVGLPLHLTPQGNMMEQGFGVGRTTLRTGPRFGEIKPVATLFAETDLARPAADPAGTDILRERLASVAEGPLSTADAQLVAPWIATLNWRKLTEPQVDVLAALIANPTATGLDRLYDGYAKHVAPRLREPIAIRLLDPGTTGNFRNRLENLVRSMPPGTYAELLPQEIAILRRQSLRIDSPALVERMTDQGAAAVPVLIRMLEQDALVQPWAKRQWVLKSYRKAFIVLGREASAALPAVENLMERDRSPLTNSSGDAQSWRVAMVRMGKPIETLRFPPNYTPEQIARDQERIAQGVAKGADYDAS